MYLPSQFSATEAETWEFIDSNSFASLISVSDNQPHISHLPLIHRQTTDGKHILLGHFASANPHSKLVGSGQKVTATFLGPDAYISHKWYESPKSVPTWNYVSIQVEGEIKMLTTKEEIGMVLAETMAKFENDGEVKAQYHPDMKFAESLSNQIVGFQINVAEIEGKFKLSQNKSLDDQRSVIKNLEETGDPNSIQIAELMKKNVERASK